MSDDLQRQLIDAWQKYECPAGPLAWLIRQRQEDMARIAVGVFESVNAMPGMSRIAAIMDNCGDDDD